MSYLNLTTTSGENWTDRIANIEAETNAQNSPNLLGSHFYAGGYVPATFTAGTDTFGIATVTWVSEIRIPENALITGLSILLGSVGGTDKIIVALFDANGNVLATSALAGVTAGTAATFQRVPFTAPFQAGPGKYYAAAATNGTTAKLLLQAAGDHDAGSITGGTFGTVVAITPPSTFTAAKAPIAMTY